MRGTRGEEGDEDICEIPGDSSCIPRSRVFTCVDSLQLQHRPVRGSGPLNITLHPFLNPDIFTVTRHNALFNRIVSVGVFNCAITSTNASSMEVPGRVGEGLGGLRQVSVAGESCRVRGGVRVEPRGGVRGVSV